MKPQRSPANALLSQAPTAAPRRKAIHARGVERDELGRNEIIFRHVNERIRHLWEKYDLGDPLEMVCECSSATCYAPIPVDRYAYEEVRADTSHFLVRPEHEDLALGRVVKRRNGYLIISRPDGE